MKIVAIFGPIFKYKAAMVTTCITSLEHPLGLIVTSVIAALTERDTSAHNFKGQMSHRVFVTKQTLPTLISNFCPALYNHLHD